MAYHAKTIVNEPINLMFRLHKLRIQELNPPNLNFWAIGVRNLLGLS